MKFRVTFLLFVLITLTAGCQKATPVCPVVTGTPDYLIGSPDHLPTATPGMGELQVQLGKSEMQVNKIIEGPLCNGDWSGTVYVACNVQVYPWEEEPTFLKNCQLNIDPLTVVYVAYHNNTAYYNGCSCHTGITPEP